MSKKTKKRMSLIKCSFHHQTNSHFENIIENIKDNLPTIEKRIVSLNLFKKNMIGKIEKLDSENIHFVEIQFVDSAPIGTVDISSDINEAAINELPAEKGKPFLDHHILLLVCENNIIECNLGNRLTSLTALINELEDKNGNTTNFHLMHTPKRQNFRNIKKYGVKQIELNITDYLTNLHDITDKESWTKFFSEPNKNIKKNAQTTGRVIIKKGRPLADENPIDEWVTQVAEEIANDANSEFTLILNDDSKISSSELMENKIVPMTKFLNGLNIQEIKIHLLEYYRELKRNRLLDVCAKNT